MSSRAAFATAAAEEEALASDLWQQHGEDRGSAEDFLDART